jgi:carbon storage regulator CsrA
MALCLTRRPGQTLVLDRPKIRITIDSVKGKSVRIVIDAPSHVKVLREELVLRLPAATEGEK